MRTDTRLAAWVRDRFGHASLAELLELGLTMKEIKYRHEQRTLLARHPGVYRHAAAAPTFEGELRAATLAAGDGAYVSGPALMRLLGIRGVWDDVPEIAVVGTRLPLLDGVRIRRLDRLDPADTTVVLGIPCLKPALALLLLGATCSERKVETAVHDAVKLGLVTPDELRDTLERYEGKGRRGVVKFRKAVERLPADGYVTETNLELDLVRLIRAAGLPEPVMQYRVTDGDGRSRRLDCAYPEAKLDIEADGDRDHGTVVGRARDNERDLAMNVVGWLVLRFTAEDIHRNPAAVAAAIRRTLSARDPSRDLTRQRSA